VEDPVPRRLEVVEWSAPHRKSLRAMRWPTDVPEHELRGVDLFVPAAAITLKQGFGRLVRTRRDRGVVALLDGRVITRGYGRRLLAALLPAQRAVDLESVRAFAVKELGGDAQG